MKGFRNRLLSVDLTQASAPDLPATGGVDAVEQTPGARTPHAPHITLPPAVVLSQSAAREPYIRINCLRELEALRDDIREFSAELKDVGDDKKRASELFRFLQRVQERIADIEDIMKTRFVPKHSPRQFIAPSDILVSPIFNVRNRKSTRQASIQLNFIGAKQSRIQYSGPELRQSDGLVFMAILNMARDIEVGYTVGFDPKALCETLYGNYCGKQRHILQETIRRLMMGVITATDISVNLVQTFEHPSRGLWSVSLDPRVVKLFAASELVWLDIQKRLELPEGLCTWLCLFLKSQTHLSTESISRLRALSGSEASDDSAFCRSLYPALKRLSESGHLESNWQVRAGVIHWRRNRKSEKGEKKVTAASPNLPSVAAMAM